MFISNEQTPVRQGAKLEQGKGAGSISCINKMIDRFDKDSGCFP